MPHPVDIHVGRKLREARSANSLSQSQLGSRLGLSFQQVQKYEKGTNRIGASRLWQLSNALGVPVGYFFDGLESDSDVEKRELPRRVIQLAHQIDSIPDDNIRNQILNLIRVCTESTTP